MMGVVNIAAVSYLNTIPFVYGIEKADSEIKANLLLDVPSGCVSKFLKGESDVALVPVGALSRLEDYKIITDYCLSAEGRVQTVELLSNTPLEEITEIYLDSHSNSSNALVKVLASHLWKISPKWNMNNSPNGVSPNIPGVAYLMIGDKVFDFRDKFRYDYDLSFEWYKLTSMPFVFAVWIARPDIDNHLVSKFNQMLKYGVAHTKDAILYYRGEKCYDENLKYLTDNIKFDFNEDKRKALAFFLRNFSSALSDVG